MWIFSNFLCSKMKKLCVDSSDTRNRVKISLPIKSTSFSCYDKLLVKSWWHLQPCTFGIISLNNANFRAKNTNRIIAISHICMITKWKMALMMMILFSHLFFLPCFSFWMFLHFEIYQEKIYFRWCIKIKRYVASSSYNYKVENDGNDDDSFFSFFPFSPSFFLAEVSAFLSKSGDISKSKDVYQVFHIKW